MPLTTSGTNMLGLVKHLAGVEAGYFGDSLWPPVVRVDGIRGRTTTEPNADMWATAD